MSFSMTAASTTAATARPLPSQHDLKPAPGAAVVVYCFSIHAEAEPGVMPRVLELFAKRGLVPTRWHSDVTGPLNGDLAIDVQVEGLDVRTGDYIARCLRQVHQVETVLTSQKHMGRG